VNEIYAITGTKMFNLKWCVAPTIV